MGHLQLPPGKKIAVNLGTDFDGQSLWLGGFNRPTPSVMSRGQFGAEVGVPRLLELYERFGVTTTWFTPGHSLDTFPEQCRKVLEAGHEFGHHGYYHEIPPGLERDTERRLVDLAFESFKNVLGIRPTGYRSPYWDYSESTLDIIEESGFLYDTSLMARDLVPYRPQRWQINWESANVAGTASSVLEIPVNWYLDDFHRWPTPGRRRACRTPRRSSGGGGTSSTTPTSGSTTRFSLPACTRRSSARPTTCSGTSG